MPRVPGVPRFVSGWTVRRACGRRNGEGKRGFPYLGVSAAIQQHTNKLQLRRGLEPAVTQRGLWHEALRERWLLVGTPLIYMAVVLSVVPEPGQLARICRCEARAWQSTSCCVVSLCPPLVAGVPWHHAGGGSCGESRIRRLWASERHCNVHVAD